VQCLASSSPYRLASSHQTFILRHSTSLSFFSSSFTEYPLIPIMSETQYLVRFGPNANCTFEVCLTPLPQFTSQPKLTHHPQLCTIEKSVYRYRPSLPANIILAAIFSFAAILHFILGRRWKTPWVMWCMILSCTHEVAGYIARVVLYINPWNFGAFITQIST
jgi:hypothetical protein